MTGQGLGRRHALLFAMGVGAAGLGLASRPVLAASSVECPTGPMKLTRKLSRGLRDGKAIIVTRSWTIVFARQSRGIAISGEQTEVSVDAPEILAQLSKIEESRSTTGMFPILLAPDGAIVAAGQDTNTNKLIAAIQTAESIITAQGLGQSNLSDASQFFTQLQKASASLLDEMPRDLFFPSTKPERQVRAIQLDGGLTGEFEVSWEANVQTGTALLAFAKREVITRIGSSERQSSEEWRLTPV